MASSSDRNSWKTQRNFDRRIVERNIRRGVITRKNYDEYLASLPDAAGNVAPPEPYETLVPRRVSAPAPVPARSPIDTLPGTPVSPDTLTAVTGRGDLSGNNAFSNGHDAGHIDALDDDDVDADDDSDDDDDLP